MSNSDGFIEEVTEELRRDKLFATMKRYGWLVGLAVVLIVGGAAYNEYRKDQAEARAQSLGDAMVAALAMPDETQRAQELASIEAATPQAQAVLNMLAAAELAEAGDVPGGVARLDEVAVNGDVPQIYRSIAQFKALVLQTETMPASDRRQGFEALAQPGSQMRLFAQEQLALIDIEEAAPDAAIDRYQAILTDAEVTPDLQERALQVIVALGGEPDLAGSPDLTPNEATATGN